MGQYSVGDAIKLLMKRSGWKPKVTELQLRENWEDIVGKTVAKYTREIHLHGSRLMVYTDVGPLKQELNMAKDQLIRNINEHMKETVVTEIVIK